MDWNEACAILGVKADASPEEIKKSYLFMIKRLHPDAQKTEEDKRLANERAKKLNEANEFLQNRDNRAKSKPDNNTRTESGLLEVIPPTIIFEGVEVGAVQFGSFEVRYRGESRGREFNIEPRPDSIVKIVNCHSVSEWDIFPLKVEFQAVGVDASRHYAEVITVKINGQTTPVIVELRMKPITQTHGQAKDTVFDTDWFRLGFTASALFLGFGLAYYFNVHWLSVVSTVIMWLVLGIALLMYWSVERLRIVLLVLLTVPVLFTLALTSPGFFIFQLFPPLRNLLTRISSAFAGALLAGIIMFFILAEPLCRSKNRVAFLLIAAGVAILSIILGITFA